MSQKESALFPQVSQKGEGRSARQLSLAHPRISRDEMNLAEFPLTVLSTRASPGTKTLEFSDTIRNKSGEITNRKWIITAADKFGLPTASDDEVLLGLLKLTVDDGVRSPKVYFTRYEMLKTLRWSTEGRSYSRLQNALDRLSGVRIKATNAFYDNETKTHSTKNFGILDAYEINDGRDNDSKKSFFIWSEVIFKSFQVGFIKKLDLDFYLALQSAVSKRIYRFLDKHFWYKSRIQMNLMVFAHEKIGISRNYKYMSSIRQQLDPAIEELIQSGFLSACEYSGKGQAAEIILYSGKTVPRVLERKGAGTERSSKNASNEKQNNVAQGDAVPNYTVKNYTVKNYAVQDYTAQANAAVMAGAGPAGVGELVQASRTTAVDDSAEVRVLQSLVDRGINEKQARKLLLEKDKSSLARIEKIISHFDNLVSSNSPHVSKNPVGFLYRAVQNSAHFNLPGESLGLKQRQTPLPFSEKEAAGRIASSRMHGSTNRAENLETLQSRFLVERKQKIMELRRTAEPALVQKISKEVDNALGKLKGLISEARYKEAIEHGVDERLAKLFAVPDFEEWVKASKRVIH